MPKGEHIRKMKQFYGCVCYAFNRALAYQSVLYESNNAVKFSYERLAYLFPRWEKEFCWLKDCHSQVLQQSLIDFCAMHESFFEKKDSLSESSARVVIIVSAICNIPNWMSKTDGYSCRFRLDTLL